MDEHPRPRVPQDGRQPRVIVVRMRQHQGVDVLQREPEPGQVARQAAGEARKAGVDGGEPAAVLDQVPVHLVRAEAVDPRGDLARVHGPEYAWGGYSRSTTSAEWSLRPARRQSCA